MKFFAILMLASASLMAAPEDATKSGKIHYTRGKDVNFEELLIQGDVQRPEQSIVTGDESIAADGLLRLREDFKDRIADDFGESIQ